MEGESFSYYSTGELKGITKYQNGKYQNKKDTDKLDKYYYNQGQEYFKEGNFKSAIKKYSKCVDIKENWAEAYFARATAILNNLEFEDAIKDFNKVLEIEPYYTYAYSNRAFAIIRKYELGSGRTLSNTNGVQVIASKEIDIPESDLDKICADLRKAISLGDDNRMVLNAFEKYCKE